MKKSKKFLSAVIASSLFCAGLGFSVSALDPIDDPNVSYIGSDTTINGALTVNGQIHGVADGTADTDAVNLGQMNAAINKMLASSGKVYTAGDHISIDSNNRISAVGVLTYDSDTKDTITLAGTGGTLLTNLRAGSLTDSSTDAVNGSQLFSVKTAIDGFSADISANAASVTAMQSTVNTINTLVSDINTTISSYSSSVANANLSNLSQSGSNKLFNVALKAVREYFDSTSSAALTSAESVSSNANVSPKAATASLSAASVAAPAAKAPAVVPVADPVLDTTDWKAELDKKADQSYVDAELAKKANVDASNIDVDAWTKKLDTGVVEAGNTGLISGGKLADAIAEAKKDRLVKTDGKVITVGADSTATTVDFRNKDGNGRVVTGIVTDGADKTSAANVGYVNTVAAYNAQAFNQKMESMRASLSKDMAKGVSAASALAALHPLDYDPNDKLSFAVGYGHYKDANSTAIGAFYHPSANVLLNAGVSIGSGDNALNAGAAFKLGKSSKYDGVSKAELARDNAMLKKTLASQSEEIEENEKRIEQLEKKLASLNL